MRRDLTLDDLQQEQVTHWLREWGAWSAVSARAPNGYNSTSAGFGKYRCSRQYDDANGALDHEADIAEMRAVDAVVQCMCDPWRTSLHAEARNLNAPAKVWRSARLDPSELVRITGEARSMLWDGMVQAGLA